MSQRWLVAVSSIFVASYVVASLHAPGLNTDWARTSILIAAGPLGFLVVCVIERVAVAALPYLVAAWALPAVPFVLFATKRKPLFLVLGSLAWLIVGWMATVGTTF